MRIAIDRNDNRVNARDALSRQDYFCEFCGKPLIFRNGDIRIKHFAHKQNCRCTDSWNISNSQNGYDSSEWHDKWQELFPTENQEVIVGNGEISHRADLLINKTVIEFQHSPISSSHFQERTNFYINLGFKVIWLFDYMDDYKSSKIIKDGYSYIWSSPKQCFRDVTSYRENFDIFFQIDEEKIIKIIKINENGFEEFSGSPFYTKNDFLNYVGLYDGKCDLPNIVEVNELNKDLIEFKEKYKVKLDKSQLRAVQTIEGANLVLAVPGSGKTTVLTYRLGYMTLVRNIDPESILAITFTKSATEEMKNRLKMYFNSDICKKIDIKTLNSFANSIVNRIDRKYSVCNDEESKKTLIAVLKNYKINYSIDNLKLYGSAISYVKSRLDQSVAMKDVFLDARIDERFKNIFKEYNDKLRENNKIDFNDQNIYALKFLKENVNLLNDLQDKYKYICVDEAQDTTQIQYEILKLISSKYNNVFMVGDEDQSIYGFNGSYPEALLNFRDEYKNPFILKLERNYRSTSQIVEFSKKFIDANVKRNTKDMYSYRGEGSEVYMIDVANVLNQAQKICDLIKDMNNVAILYRENISAIPIVDIFEKNSIEYSFIKNDVDFFETSNFKRFFSYLELYRNQNNYGALRNIEEKIYYRGLRKPMYEANRMVTQGSETNLFEATIHYIENNPFNFEDNSRINSLQKTREFIESFPSLDVKEIIIEICDKVVSKNQVEKMKEILLSISNEIENIDTFIDRLYSLRNKINFKFTNSSTNVILSTIHSAKGMEFDNVILVDVYDGSLPLVEKDVDFKKYEEERRIFYVGITRARNNLYITNYLDRESSFNEENFPNHYVKCRFDFANDNHNII